MSGLLYLHFHSFLWHSENQDLKFIVLELVGSLTKSHCLMPMWLSRREMTCAYLLGNTPLCGVRKHVKLGLLSGSYF